MDHQLHGTVLRPRHRLQCRDGRQPTENSLTKRAPSIQLAKRGRASVLSPSLHMVHEDVITGAPRWLRGKVANNKEATGNVNNLPVPAQAWPFQTGPHKGSEHFSEALWSHAVEEHGNPTCTLQHTQALESDTSFSPCLAMQAN